LRIEKAGESKGEKEMWRKAPKENRRNKKHKQKKLKENKAAPAFLKKRISLVPSDVLSMRFFLFFDDCIGLVGFSAPS